MLELDIEKRPMFARRYRRSLKTWDVPISILQTVGCLFKQSQERQEQLQESQHKG